MIDLPFLFGLVSRVFATLVRGNTLLFYFRKDLFNPTPNDLNPCFFMCFCTSIQFLQRLFIQPYSQLC